MATMTADTATAPRFDEFPRLARARTRELFEAAADLKRRQRLLDEQMAKIRGKLSAELELALADSDTKSVVYGSGEDAVLFTRTAGGPTKRLDTKWARRTLMRKGISAEEIDEHSKVTEREPGVRIQLLGEASADKDEDER